MSGVKDGLVYWWDLAAADTNITDQHSGLILTKIGTTTTISGGAPDGGNCVSVGDGIGKYRNASESKLIKYEYGFSANIWAFVTGISSPFGNWLINHRGDPSAPPDNRYFQLVTQSPTVGDFVAVIDTTPTSRTASSGLPAASLNQWVMLTAVDNGTQTSLYRNGVLVGTSTTSLGARATGPAAFAIGGDSWNVSINNSTTHRGRVSMAGVWDRPLTADEITWLYNSGTGRRYNALRYSKYGLGGEVLWVCPSLDDIGVGTVVARDLTPNRNHGTLTNMDAASDWVLSEDKYALDLDGIDDRVVASNTITSFPLSISAFFRTGSTNSTFRTIVGFGDSANTTNHIFIGLTDTHLLRYNPRTSSTDAIVNSIATYNDSAWHHAVAVSSSANSHSLYIDGTLVATSSTNLGTAPVLNQFAIGCLPRSTNVSFFPGMVDDIRIFQRVLTQAEITKLASQRGYQLISGSRRRRYAGSYGL